MMNERTWKNEEDAKENPAFSNELVVTKDGSHTLYSARFNQWYHSVSGAFEESRRIFLELGFDYMKASGKSSLRILEMGFGTGFNALLTLLKAQEENIPVHYTSLEAYPVSAEEYQKLNYDDFMHSAALQTLHQAPWNEAVTIQPNFTLYKLHTTIQDFIQKQVQDEPYDLVYYDAFAPNSQPELWTPEIFAGLAQRLHAGSVLTTYCSKGDVRRALQAAGFRIEKHPGPGRKREVVRAILQ
ncbi:tRNA (5-methylaminomethyl-2-thiouridine)(34)-methyltransferase MnmD [Siphonobacter sp. SORGH_AS_0500]|uniref:tRNA (5-methylaminomethyl-2-thiouridine)(34)-methyltransferase MnmD n=1 Tax=Siphonobacter sp. SORGH_AS_0500 TaxID=1864824 RepID=UPI001E40144F|nr:tRNA (5-methylaminomethyl-2-thiouridine)(34)-methyltransferase MnmD [Siphonobacter sp. SORGH_AS_0500]MDR6193734.1 tRNA U34 5-methylaminomethyl-2-thiouridine-forming methyltransferase MnmC [Siphonobacter sp. SORGH_AS_0500]